MSNQSKIWIIYIIAYDIFIIIQLKPVYVLLWAIIHIRAIMNFFEAMNFFGSKKIINDTSIKLIFGNNKFEETKFEEARKLSEEWNNKTK